MTQSPPHRFGAVLLACAWTLPAAAQTAAGVDRSTAPSEAGQTRTPALPGATSYPARAAGDGATQAGYNPSRWAEDWRAMADPKKRDDPLDRLKFLALGADGIYLTLSGELRLRVNTTSNPGLKNARSQRQDINRIFAGADLHLGPNVRFYGELAHGGLAGRNLGTPAATMRNDLIVQQAFGELRGDVAGMSVGARHGRQEFADGAPQLVSTRDNNTIRFVVNGTRAWARSRLLRADIFDLKFTRYGTEGASDDVIDHDRRLTGITGGIVLPRQLFGGSTLFVDPFLWRLRNRAATWGPTTAAEQRFLYGARIWGEAGRAIVDWTVDRQAGHVDGRRIDAWQFFAAQTYRLGAAATAPRVGVHVDYASGGGAYRTGTLHDAVSPFANGPYYSYGQLLTPTNLALVAGNFTFSPARRVRLTSEYQLVGRPAENDAVYRSSGAAYAGTQRVAGSRVADVLRSELVWTITPRVSVTGRYEHLHAGPVLTRAGYAGTDFGGLWVSFRM